MNKTHLTQEQFNVYLKYLMRCLPEGTDFAEIYDIQEHLAACEVCLEEMQQLHNKAIEINNWSYTKLEETAERVKLLKFLRGIQKSTDDATIKQFISNIIRNFDEFLYKSLFIYMSSAKPSARLQNAILFDEKNSYYRYDTTNPGNRGGDDDEIINYTEVISSKKIEKQTNVNLLPKEKKIIVSMEKEKHDFYPKLILLKYDDLTTDIKRIAFKEPVYNKEKNLLECTFEDLKKGRYFLFIEPQPII